MLLNLNALSVWHPCAQYGSLLLSALVVQQYTNNVGKSGTGAQVGDV